MHNKKLHVFIDALPIKGLINRLLPMFRDTATGFFFLKDGFGAEKK
jgi:hypothetical protein